MRVNVARALALLPRVRDAQANVRVRPRWNSTGVLS
jgi:hypothetical protein